MRLLRLALRLEATSPAATGPTLAVPAGVSTLEALGWLLRGDDAPGGAVEGEAELVAAGERFVVRRTLGPGRREARLEGNGAGSVDGWDAVTDACGRLFGGESVASARVLVVDVARLREATAAGSASLLAAFADAGAGDAAVELGAAATRELATAELRRAADLEALQGRLSEAGALLGADDGTTATLDALAERRARLVERADLQAATAGQLRAGEEELTALMEREEGRRRQEEELASAARRVRELEAREPEIARLAERVRRARAAAALLPRVETVLPEPALLAELDSRRSARQAAERVHESAEAVARAARAALAHERTRDEARAAVVAEQARLTDLATRLVDLEEVSSRLKGAQAARAVREADATAARRERVAASSRVEVAGTAVERARERLSGTDPAEVERLAAVAREAEGRLASRRRLDELSVRKAEAVKAHARLEIRRQRVEEDLREGVGRATAADVEELRAAEQQAAGLATALTGEVLALRHGLGPVARARLVDLEREAADSAAALARLGAGPEGLVPLERELADARAADEQAERRLGAAAAEVERHEEAEAAARERLAEVEATVPAPLRTVEAVEAALRATEARGRELAETARRVEAEASQAEAELQAAAAALDRARTRERALRDRVHEEKGALVELLRGSDFSDLEDYRAARLAPDEIDALEEQVGVHETQLEAARRLAHVPATVGGARTRAIQHDLGQVGRLLAVLPSARAQAEEMAEGLLERLRRADGLLGSLEEVGARLARWDARQRALARIATLCSAEGGRPSGGFAEHLASAWRDEWLVAAAERLRAISDGRLDLDLRADEVAVVDVSSGMRQPPQDLAGGDAEAVAVALALAAAAVHARAAGLPGEAAFVVGFEPDRLPPPAREHARRAVEGG